ncbi:putative porin, partial [Selenomonas ruminantium]
GVDKALVDKLAAEFAEELNNLGVRVSNLERNADMVKWNGKAEYTYWSHRDKDAHTKTNDDQLLFRLEPSAEVNSHWHVNARLDASTDLAKDTAGDNHGDAQDSNVKLKRIWAQGEYGKFQVKLGKFASLNDDSIADTPFSGAEVSYGKDVKVILGAGRLDIDDVAVPDKTRVIPGLRMLSKSIDKTANYQYAGLEVTKGKLFGGAYWHHLNASNFNYKSVESTLIPGYMVCDPAGYAKKDTDEFNTWMLKGAYTFSKNVGVNGFYAQNHDADYYKKAGSVEVTYKGAQKENRGTWGAWVAYRHLGVNAIVASPWDVVGLNQKAWEVGGNYTIFKNVVGTLRYGHGKDLDDKNKVENLFGRVEFFF